MYMKNNSLNPFLLNFRLIFNTQLKNVAIIVFKKIFRKIHVIFMRFTKNVPFIYFRHGKSVKKSQGSIVFFVRSTVDFSPLEERTCETLESLISTFRNNGLYRR